MAGFVPIFFGDGTLATFANYKGGVRAAVVIPFLSGIVVALGTALCSNLFGLASYGGYNSLFDWVTVWPVFTLGMKYLGYIGVALAAVVMLAIPQIQYARHKDTYFLITDDYEAYKKLKEEKK